VPGSCKNNNNIAHHALHAVNTQQVTLVPAATAVISLHRL